MSIAQDLACGKPSCPCDKTARTANGVTHCPVPGHGKGWGDNIPSLSLTTKDDGKEPLNREEWLDRRERNRQNEIEIRLECLEAKAEGRNFDGGFITC